MTDNPSQLELFMNWLINRAREDPYDELFECIDFIRDYVADTYYEITNGLNDKPMNTDERKAIEEFLRVIEENKG